MSARWLIRKEQRQLDELSAQFAVNKLAIEYDKAELMLAAADKLSSPAGIGASFAAGCATEWLVEKRHDNPEALAAWSGLAKEAMGLLKGWV